MGAPRSRTPGSGLLELLDPAFSGVDTLTLREWEPTNEWGPCNARRWRRRRKEAEEEEEEEEGGAGGVRLLRPACITPAARH